MAREHATIAMTDEELSAFVSSQTRCIVATVDPDGTPWGDAAASMFRDGSLYFRVPSGTRTLRNLDADPRVCCTLESYPTGAGYYTIKAVMLHGQAVRAGDDGEVRSAFDALPDPVTGSPDDGVIFSVGVDDAVSFDFAKIKRRFEQ